MKTTSAFALAFFSTAIAAPAAIKRQNVDSVTITLTEDVKSIPPRGSASIPVNGEIMNIADLYSGTPIFKDGKGFAASAEITSGIGQGVLCDITGGEFKVQLSAEHTYSSLGESKGEPVDVTNWKCNCSRPTTTTETWTTKREPLENIMFQLNDNVADRSYTTPIGVSGQWKKIDDLFNRTPLYRDEKVEAIFAMVTTELKPDTYCKMNGGHYTMIFSERTSTFYDLGLKTEQGSATLVDLTDYMICCGNTQYPCPDAPKPE